MRKNMTFLSSVPLNNWTSCWHNFWLLTYDLHYFELPWLNEFMKKHSIYCLRSCIHFMHKLTFMNLLFLFHSSNWITFWENISVKCCASLRIAEVIARVSVHDSLGASPTYSHAPPPQWMSLVLTPTQIFVKESLPKERHLQNWRIKTGSGHLWFRSYMLYR
jgi:hypothetical protein